jgi:hypothetical protein
MLPVPARRLLRLAQQVHRMVVVAPRGVPRMETETTAGGDQWGGENSRRKGSGKLGPSGRAFETMGLRGCEGVYTCKANSTMLVRSAGAAADNRPLQMLYERLGAAFVTWTRQCCQNRRGQHLCSCRHVVLREIL